MKKIIVVMGLFGGLAKQYYAPLAEIFGQTDFEIFRAGADWNPAEIANKIRQIKGEKVVICLSLGAMVGNIVANDEKTDVYYICPFLGYEFNRRAYRRKLRVFFRGLAAVCMAITKLFEWHRWYPPFGGTKPDGHFLSAYAICRQLWYSFGKTPEVNQASGVIYSEGDTTVDPEVIKKYFPGAIVAKRADGGEPYHANFREEGRSFGKAKTTAGVSVIGEDAKAYASALAQSFVKRLL